MPEGKKAKESIDAAVIYLKAHIQEINSVAEWAAVLFLWTDRIGAGPLVGYRYIFLDFEDPTGFFDPDDRSFWDFEYGLKVGWYAPAKVLFNASSMGETHLFLDGGISWLRERRKIESFGKTKPNTRLGYQVSSGLLIPVGKQIALEGKLQWEARERHYRVRILDQFGNTIRTINETRWPSVLSVAVGFKVLF